MIERLYVNNFRCLENFDLRVSGQSSILLIGRNGAGKTTVSHAIEILQKIARGTNRVRELVTPRDFSRGKTDSPMRFKIDAQIDSKIYQYELALEFPDGYKELRIFEESLTVDGATLYKREISKVQLARPGKNKVANLLIDWHLVALPIIQEKSASDPLSIFKKWLSQILILRPLPRSITGESSGETLQPEDSVQNLGAWFAGVMALAPSAYARVDSYLKQIMPDLQDIKNPVIGTESRRLSVQFASERGTIELPFSDLSDGEKCYVISSLVIASQAAYGPLVCFWDEPDNHIELSEVGYFIMTLRKTFLRGGQFIATSHNPEAVRRFSEENTLVLSRASHLEPTAINRVIDLKKSGGINGDLVEAMVRGDIGA